VLRARTRPRGPAVSSTGSDLAQRTRQNERVRRSHAAPAAGGTGAVDGARRPVHVTRRQVAFALALTLTGIVVAIFIFDAVRSSSDTFPAVVTPSTSVDLNFPGPGDVATIAVRPGQVVHAGDVLATQDTTVLDADVAAATALVGAGQAAVDQAQAPQVPGPQQNQTQLQVRQAQASVQQAQQAVAAAGSVGQASVNAAQAVVDSGQSIVSSDSARFAQACPNGVVAPGPQAPADQVQTSFHCQDLQAQLTRDQAGLHAAQAQVGLAQAQANESVANQRAALTSAQLSLSLAQNQGSVQAAPATPATVAQAQANLAQAKAGLAQAEAARRQATLTAPFAGTVAEVYGSVGQHVGPDGVHQTGGPPTSPSTQSSGSQPSPATSSTPTTTTTGSQPVIRLTAGPWRVVAPITRKAASRFKPGRSAHVSIYAASWSGSAVVAEVVPAPAASSGPLTYDVVFDLPTAPDRLVPGMSASATTP